MATKEETRARLEALKKDQEALKTELAALDTFMEKKARAKEPAPMPREPPREQYREPYPQYREQYPPREPPRYREPAPPAYGRDDEMFDLLKRNLDESRKMMDKFDYLLDTLISSMEEVEGENADELVKALAQSQMHVMEVLSSIKSGLDEASEEAATKKELDTFEREQATHYQELNKKLNALMEQMQSPPYLQELDQIRVAVGNLGSELSRLQKEGVKSGGVSEEFKAAVAKLQAQADSLEDRTGGIYSSLANISDHINQLQATAGELSEIKRQMERTREMLSAKDDEILNETQMHVGVLDEKIGELNAALSKFGGVEAALAKLPTGQLAHLSEELEAIKTALPSTSLKELHSKLDRIESELSEQLKKNESLGDDREILRRLVDKAGRLEDGLAATEERIAAEEAATAFSHMALENKVSAVEELAHSAEHYDDIKQLQREIEKISGEMRKVRRQLKAAEVIETFTRVKERGDDLDRVEGLDARLQGIAESLGAKAAELEAKLNAGEEVSGRRASEAAETMRSQLEALRWDIGTVSSELKDEEGKLAALPGGEELKALLDEQRAKLAEIESQFDRRTGTFERELSGLKGYLDAKRQEREEMAQAQLEALRQEVVKARAEAGEVPKDLDVRISKIYSEMERMKRETPEELKELARQIGTVSNAMDAIQRGLREGEARGEHLAELAGAVNKLYSQVNALAEESGRSQRLLGRIDALERALAAMSGMHGREMESSLGAIKSELAAVEKEVGEIKGGEAALTKEVQGVHGAISQLERKTRDELHATIGDLKKQAASAGDVASLKTALAAIEKRVAKEDMEQIHNRVVLATRAADLGDMAAAKEHVKAIEVPAHPVAVDITPRQLEKLEHQFRAADEGYRDFADRARQLREDYKKAGLTEQLQKELEYLEEDLLDYWLDKRGLAEALEQARKGNIAEAQQLLEYEQSVLEELRLDINSLRMKAAVLPHKAIAEAKQALERREHAEGELSEYGALAESVERMRKEREKLQKELEAAKARGMKALVPERVQESLDAARDRPTPAVGAGIAQLERDLADKRVVPISEANLAKAGAKIGELAGRAKQIEFGTDDRRATVAKEQLEQSRQRLGDIASSSGSLKQAIIAEELAAAKGSATLDELAFRTGISAEEIAGIIPSIAGNYTLSNGVVTKPKAI